VGSGVRTFVPLKRSVVLPTESVPNLVRSHAMDACDRVPESGLASLPRSLTSTCAVNSLSSVGEAEGERLCSFCILAEMSLLHRVLEVDRDPRFVRPFTTRRKSRARSACGLPHNHQE
jgi:hypothetical protein